MSICVSWLKDCQFKVTTSNGFEIQADADNKAAPCPTEILLSALGSCSATDVVMGLQEQGVELASFNSTLSYTLTTTEPQLYESVNLHFTVKATDVSENQIASAANQAINKYCHVCLMLQPKINITFSIEITQ